MAQVRAKLTAYAQLMHQPFGKLVWTPYRAFGELELALEAPRVRLVGSISERVRQPAGNGAPHLARRARGFPRLPAWIYLPPTTAASRTAWGYTTR